MIIMDIPNHTIYKDFDNNALKVVSAHPLVNVITVVDLSDELFFRIRDALFYYRRIARSIFTVYACTESNYYYFLVDLLSDRFTLMTLKDTMAAMSLVTKRGFSHDHNEFT